MTGFELGRVALRGRRAAHEVRGFALLRVLFASSLALTLGACAELRPQMFSDRLAPPPPSDKTKVVATTGGSITVADAKKDIESVQRKYLSAVTDLSALSPRTNAALIGLSAVALYKGLTGGSTEGIAGLGVLGSGVWAYGTTMASKPRQLVYLEGARALSCVVTVAEPYNVASDWVADLRTKTEAAATQFEALRKWRDDYAQLNETRSQGAVAGSRPAGCGQPPQCATTGVSEALAQACRDEQAEFNRQCAVRGGSPARQFTPAPEVVAAFKQAEEEQSRLQRAMSSADGLYGSLQMAGPKLYEQSVRIQLLVSAEVLKTEPDPASVLATLKNLKQVAGVVAGAPLEPPGEAQGEADVVVTPGVLDDRARAAVRELQSILLASQQARVRLDRKLAEMDARVREVNRNFDQCQFTAPGVPPLVVSPSSNDIQIAVGGQQRFFVSGGSGTPIGSVANVGSASPGVLARELDESGAIRFTYTVPTDADPGDKVTLLFSDGARQVTHDVTITAIAATTATSGGGGTPESNTNTAPKPKDVPPR